ncbi:hypothetical protein OGAPHI_000334 [Ogataea philodendri]|uniref:DnaJ homologue subfamily C member 28 conserved domain-containing protein n=1 Tax=Ogataea philodendri TaxID=1378263 RepID=A0A9P8TAH9_9ASCO|nr:uncharacterized protein OGAPHI_000334 [Ogataea philodendri]KAH3671629.1 hypothetical protein OGAPHI_000334 [Ogataea philodendri]
MIKRSLVVLNAESGAMKRRLEQLAEDARPIAGDDRAGTVPDALPVDLPGLRAKLDRIQDQNFEHQYQREIGLTKLPTYAGKQEREIAAAPVWTGKESVYDASLRMLNDKYKTVSKQNTKQRLHRAREGAIDYQLDKVSEKKQKKDAEDDGFSELYRERLLGPAVFVSDTFAAVDNSVRSLADQRIMEAQRRGDFKNLPRGKALESEYRNTNAYLDRTEYHLNNILKRQEAIPPWIEKQGSVDVQIRQFRSQLDSDWTSKAVHIVCDRYPMGSDSDKIQLMERYAQAEKDGGTSHSKLRSREWEQHHGEYLKTKLRVLNDSIRGYNLQAPLASQKLYLIQEKELEKCYQRCADKLVGSLKRHLLGSSQAPVARASKKEPNQRLPKYGEVKQRDIKQTYQVPSESLGRQLINMFRWGSKDE